ncbi:MAG: gliding motility protein GldN [Bacteroidetes bacterium]|nr:gliding motility protein GldN [Bacteroidota bacterium]
MKKITFVVCLLMPAIIVGTFYRSEAQVLDGIYVKEHVPARKPVPYHQLREADMMWTKRIWRIIDMKQKINLPLYYPTRTDEISGRMSFVNLVLRAWRGDFATVSDPRLTLYDFNMLTDDFAVLAEADQIDLIKKLSPDYVDTLSVSPGAAPSSTMIKWDDVFMATYQVTRLLIKEDWYFDKQRAKLEVRIVGIAPILMLEISDPNTGEVTGYKQKPWFWIYFPEARSVFANHEVFNPFNDAERRTFDDIFFYRKFDSYIFKESNVYNDREIALYKVGLDALLESEKIKNWMFEIEHDLWEY